MKHLSERAPQATSIFLEPLPARVVTIKRESPDAVSWILEIPSEHPSDLPAWRPGQFYMIYVYGCGEAAISISGEGGAPHRVMHTIKRAGSLTRMMTLWDTPEEAKDRVSVRGPFGSFWPDIPPESDVILMGGGIGFAPLRSLLEKYGKGHRLRRIVALYGMRKPDDALYRDEWAGWTALPRVEFIPMVDKTNTYWHGEVGYLPTILPRIVTDPQNTFVMLCGPEIMMRLSIQELSGLRVPPHHIFLSIERHMKCAIGLCGRCQLGPFFVCRDGPVFCFSQIAPFWHLEEF